MDYSRPLAIFSFCLLKCRIARFNFANVGIPTTVLWCRNQVLYQLSRGTTAQDPLSLRRTGAWKSFCLDPKSVLTRLRTSLCILLWLLSRQYLTSLACIDCYIVGVIKKMHWDKWLCLNFLVLYALTPQYLALSNLFFSSFLVSLQH